MTTEGGGDDGAVSTAKKLRHDSDQDGVEADPFRRLEVVKILNDITDRKFIAVEGKYANRDGKVVVVLEKTPFDPKMVEKLLQEHCGAEANLVNDIYADYTLQTKPAYNGIKVSTVYPATQKHIDKYSVQKAYLVEERPEDYEDITLPYITEEAFSLQWVYNILDKKKESERIIFEDPDPETGFIMVPDMKWGGVQVEDLYVICLVHQRGIKSIRDLNASHLPLLRNIATAASAAISQRYGLPYNQLRMYVHYQPSYYHLHIHVTSLQYQAPGISVDRAHLLADIIDNISLDPLFYSKKTLHYCLRENDKLLARFRDKKHQRECPSL